MCNSKMLDVAMFVGSPVRSDDSERHKLNKTTCGGNALSTAYQRMVAQAVQAGQKWLLHPPHMSDDVELLVNLQRLKRDCRGHGIPRN